MACVTHGSFADEAPGSLIRLLPVAAATQTLGQVYRAEDLEGHRWMFVQLAP